MPTARARNTDPHESHIAAEHMNRLGITAHQSRQVLAAVRQWPGSTSAELAQRMGAERVMPARRLSELAEDGHVVKGRSRTCSVNGSTAATWYPLPHQMELAA